MLIYNFKGKEGTSVNGEAIVRRLKMICYFLSTARSILSVLETLFSVLRVPIETMFIVNLKNFFALAEAIISVWIALNTQQDK